MPIGTVKRCLEVLRNSEERRNYIIFGFVEWLNSLVDRLPEEALAATEAYLEFITNTETGLHDHGNHLTQLITRLFGEAEEREETDHGEMLKCVVAIQDVVLSLGINGVDDWLKAAERP
jgi:hypothetical protein